MSDKPLAVLVDPGVPVALAELLRDYPLPLVPMGTKPMVAHWLERLKTAGLDDVLVLLEHLPEKTREWLEHSAPEGMNIQCGNIRKGQAYKTQFAHLANTGDRPLAVFEMSAFPKEDIVEPLRSKLQQAGVVSVEQFEAWAKKLAHHVDASFDVLSRDYIAGILLPVDIWQINMDILEGKLKDSSPFGFEAETNCYVASNCKIASDVRYRAPLAIGESCIFSPRVNIGPNVVAAEKCVFDVGSFVQNCVVFGRTFIGSHIVLRNALVSGSMVYLVDEDRVVHIDDMALLARRDAPNLSVTPQERLMAILTLLLVAVPIGCFAVYRGIKKQPLFMAEDIFIEAGRDLNGFRAFRRLSVRSLLVDHQRWRKVPWLLQVINSQLSLVGTSPRESDRFEYPSWVTDAEEFLPGVMSLADITVEKGASSEDIVIADAYQLARGEVGGHIGMWCRWLLSLFVNKS
ncbi:MAG TPA: hypothetical protein VLA24_07570 [Pseudomonadales bacterium]|nr:hypothetical protein [Pseudomonadales bacterium]